MLYMGDMKGFTKFIIFVFVIIAILVLVPDTLTYVKDIVAKGSNMLQNQTMGTQESTSEVITYDLIVSKQCDNTEECNEFILECAGTCYCDDGMCKQIIEN